MRGCLYACSTHEPVANSQFYLTALLLAQSATHAHPRTRFTCRATELQRDQSFKPSTQERRVYNRTSSWGQLLPSVLRYGSVRWWLDASHPDQEGQG